MGGLEQCYVYHNDLEVYKLSQLPRELGFAKSTAEEELCRCYGLWKIHTTTAVHTAHGFPAWAHWTLYLGLWCVLHWTGETKSGQNLWKYYKFLSYFDKMVQTTFFPEKILLKWEISIIFSLIFPDFHSFEDLELFWNWNLNNLCQLSEFPH